MKSAIWVMGLAVLGSWGEVPGQQVLYRFQHPGQSITVASSAGDVDADGFEDVVLVNFIPGPVAGADFYVHSGRTGGTLLNWISPVPAAYQVGRAGDVNGDGHDDILVGDWLAGVAAGVYSYSGSVTVHSGLDGSILWRRDGSPGDTLGTLVTGLGDVNVDGYDDVAALAVSRYVVVYSGIDGSVLHTITSTSLILDQLAKAGDVDLDGVPDFVVSGRSTSSAGQVLVQVISGFNGAVIWSWLLASNNSALLDGGQDVDNDGHADILVGNPGFSGTQLLAGQVVVYSGAMGTPIHTITNSQVIEQFGRIVVMLGDVDGDGHAEFATRDFIPGRHRVFSGATGQVIASWELFTQSEVDSGDVNGDGARDLISYGSVANQGEVQVISIAPVPAAAVTFLGAGCSAVGQAPLLRLSGLPVLGSALRLDILNAPPSSSGLLLGSGPTTMAPLLISPGCVTHLDPSSLFQMTAFTTDPAGTFQLPLTLATGSIHSGLTFNLQAAFFLPTAMSFSGLTNALQITLGY